MPTPPDPISERIAASIVTTLKGVTTAAGYSGTLDVIRLTTSMEGIDATDLKTVVSINKAIPEPAFWGQQGWVQAFDTEVYVREPKDSGVAIDHRLNLVVSDVLKALMLDRRRGGLCYRDSGPSLLDFTDGIEAGRASVLIRLLCPYRTLIGDPAALAPASTNELIFQGGAVLLLAPYTGPRSIGAWRRYDNLKIVPLLGPETEVARGDREGPARGEAEIFVAHVPRYEIDGDWLSPQALSWQLAGGDVGTYVQSAAPVEAAQHVVLSLDAVLPLRDPTSGESVFPIASVEAVTNLAGSVTYTAGSDYIVDADGLREGLLKIPAGSTMIAGATVRISFTPAAVTARPAFDVAIAGETRVRARVTWLAADGQMIVHPDFDGSIVAHSVTSVDGDPVRTKYHLTVLDNSDSSGRPAGRLLFPAGPLPVAAGF